MSTTSFINAPTVGYEKRKFNIVETIDRFRSLYKAKPNNSNIHDVFVTIKSFQQLDEKQKTRFPQVLEILKGSKIWSQIVTVYDYFEQQNKFYIVMEYGELTLKQYLQNNNEVTLLQKLTYCQQICESIKFIHDNGHMHRDIRPENFVMIEQKSNRYLVKLTDFGIMRDDPPENCEQTEIADCTYQTYTAPEILRQQKYDKKCDIWSLGCVFYEILTGKQLFNQNSINSKQIDNEQYINSEIQKMTIPQQLMEIIQQMMSQNPENRPDIKEIINTLIDNQQIIERQYEMIRLYYEQRKLNKWVEDLRLTLKSSNNMNQEDEISDFFSALVDAVQNQKSEGNNRLSKKIEQQNFNNTEQIIGNPKTQDTIQESIPITAQKVLPNKFPIQQPQQNGFIKPNQQTPFNPLQPQQPKLFPQQWPVIQNPIVIQPNPQGIQPPTIQNLKPQFPQNQQINTMQKK